MPEGKLTKRTNIMKKIISILLVFAAMLSLSGCIGKIRVLENYSIGEYNGGWSVLYTDEKGVEEIAAIGDRATFQHGSADRSYVPLAAWPRLPC